MHEMLIKALRDEANEAPAISSVGYLLMRKAANVIEELDAADVRPVVRAAWRGIGKTGRIFVCSACDKTFPYKTRYCPNCGADMREEG